jgi:hypothetical protein
MRVVLPLLLMLSSCASLAGAVASECAAALVQGAAEVCCDAAIGALCEDDGDLAVDDEEPAAEIPPPPPREPLPDVPPCATRTLPGGVFRLDCVDGTTAEALLAEDTAAEDDAAGAGSVKNLADVARLANVRGFAGSLRITGPALLRVELPSLHRIDGDFVVEQTAQLATLRLGALVQVDGVVRLLHNRALRGDPCPQLARAGAVDIAFNDGLAPAVVDRLLALAPPPTVDKPD